MTWASFLTPRLPIEWGVDLSIGTLCASLIVSSIGCGLFMYGKKQARIPQLVVGLALMGSPYFAGEVGAVLGIAAVLILGLVAALRAGW